MNTSTKPNKEKIQTSSSKKKCERCGIVLDPRNRVLLVSKKKNPTICLKCAWKRTSRLFGDSPLHHRIIIGLLLGLVPIVNLFGYMVLGLTFVEMIKKPKMLFESRINYLIRAINSEQYTPATATLFLGLFLGYVMSMQVRYEVGFLIWVVYVLPGSLILGVAIMGELHAYFTPRTKNVIKTSTRF
ncbi:MAG: hypothetical protein ACTSYA_00385 [Candidatus Kariarchaeaceae archaeon]